MFISTHVKRPVYTDDKRSVQLEPPVQMHAYEVLNFSHGQVIMQSFFSSTEDLRPNQMKSLNFKYQISIQLISKYYAFNEDSILQA